MEDYKINEYTKTKEGFEQLYKHFAPKAIRSATMMIGNKHLAADAVQETFLRIYSNLDKFDSSKPFEPWMYRILINECKRLCSKNKKIVYIEEYFENMIVEEDKNSQNLEFEDLFKILESLDEKIRTPIILKYLNDMKIDDIAKILELNVNTIKSRLHFGRNKLKDMLSTEYKLNAKKNINSID